MDSQDLVGDCCPICEFFNEPNSTNTCEHHIGWKWDGVLEVDDDIRPIEEKWESIKESAQSGLSDFDEGDEHSATNDIFHCRGITALAERDTSFEDILELGGAVGGAGWRTGGMLGGTGRNLYAKERDKLENPERFFTHLRQKVSPSTKIEVSAPDYDQARLKASDAIAKRSILVIVTRWPDGTMAFKFGAALFKAMGPAKSNFEAIYTKRERIFRVETDVTEEQFRAVLRDSEASCPGRVLFVEIS